MKPTRATTGLTAVAAIAAVLLGATSCAQDETPSEQPTATAEPGDPSESSAAPPAELVDFGTEPALRPNFKRQSLKAVGDGMIAMVPSALAEGWSVGGAGYTAQDPQWWRMEFTAPTGTTVLDQLGGDRAAVLDPHLAGLTQADDVDLSKWGIGTWEQWVNGDKSLLAMEVKRSVVVVQAPDLETATDLAKSLLPAEDSRSTEG